MNVNDFHLPAEKLNLLSGFTKLSDVDLAATIERYSKLPVGYIDFLRRFGFGKVRDNGEPDNFPAHFELLRSPKSAQEDYFRDGEFMKYGAKGDVLIFGLESTGIAYGFDIGNSNALVQVDNYRLVSSLKMGFCEFIFGIFACYPDFPDRYSEGYWFNDIGERHSVHGRA